MGSEDGFQACAHAEKPFLPAFFTVLASGSLPTGFGGDRGPDRCCCRQIQKRRPAQDPTRASGLKVAPRPAHDLSCPHRTDLARALAAVFEQDHRGNASNPVSGAERLFGFGVDLCQTDLRLKPFSGLDELWRHRLAGATPGRPEIDQHRDVISADVFLESRGCKFGGMRIKQRLMTLPTLRLFAQPRRRHAVHRLAVWADQMQYVTH